MTYVLRFLLMSWLLLFGACTPPTGPPPPTTTTTTLERPPRIDEPFDWSRYAGFSAFTLETRDARRVFAEAQAHGWNTARVCAETEFWNVASSSLKRLPRDERRLHDLLDEVARIPGVQLLLIGNCTLKGPVPLTEQLQWHESVMDLINGHFPGGGAVPAYRNVAYEVVNEPWNCRGRGWGPYCLDAAAVNQMIEGAQREGLIALADDHACIRDMTLRSQYRGPADFHPCRSDPSTGRPWDPNETFLRKLVASNSGFALLSETVAYGPDDGGLVTEDRERIVRYIRACNAVPGCLFTYHSVDGLRAENYEWWPDARP